MAVTSTYGPALHELRGLQHKARDCFNGLTMLMDGKWHEYNYLRDQLVCIDSKAPKDGEGRERRHYEVIREQTKALLRDLHVTLRVLRAALDETYISDDKEGVVVVRDASTERTRSVSETEGGTCMEGVERQHEEEGMGHGEGRGAGEGRAVVGEGNAAPQQRGTASSPRPFAAKEVGGRPRDGSGRRGRPVPSDSKTVQVEEEGEDDEEEEEDEEESDHEDQEEASADVELQPSEPPPPSRPLPTPPCPPSVSVPGAATLSPPPCPRTSSTPTASVTTPASPPPPPSPPCAPHLASLDPPVSPCLSSHPATPHGGTATPDPPFSGLSSRSRSASSSCTSNHTPHMPCPSPMASPARPRSAFSSPAHPPHRPPLYDQGDKEEDGATTFVETLLD